MELQMKLPVELNHTKHKHGGIIERIDAIKHECAKPVDGHSQDIWYFVGAVQWRDGGRSEQARIPPYMLCADDGDEEPEIHELMALMNEYLDANGKWYHEGNHQGWYAYERPQIRRRA